MRSLYFVSVFVLICGVAAAEPGTVEVRVEGLCGLYEVSAAGNFNSERYDTLRVEYFPTEISSISIRIIGEAVVGERLCDSGETTPAVLTLSGVFWNLENGYYWPLEEIVLSESGTFDLTRLLVPNSYAAFLDDFLRSGSPILDFHLLDSAGDSCRPYSPYSSVTLSDIVVTIEGDFPVGAEGSNWGGIKSLFMGHH